MSVMRCSLLENFIVSSRE